MANEPSAESVVKAGQEVWVRGKVVAPANEHGRIEVICDSDEQFWVNAKDILLLDRTSRAARLAEAQWWMNAPCGEYDDGTRAQRVATLQAAQEK
jgi:hypothetical protein